MSKKIMIVDDEEDIRISVGQILEVSGYKVVEAIDGKDCLNKLKRGIPNLVLLDIMMPGMSGWETQQCLLDHPVWKNIPIIFLTAIPERGIKDIENFEGDDYVEKPIDIIDLKRRIRNILRRRKKAVSS